MLLQLSLFSAFVLHRPGQSCAQQWGAQPKCV